MSRAETVINKLVEQEPPDPADIDWGTPLVTPVVSGLWRMRGERFKNHVLNNVLQGEIGSPEDILDAAEDVITDYAGRNGYDVDRLWAALQRVIGWTG